MGLKFLPLIIPQFSCLCYELRQNRNICSVLKAVNYAGLAKYGKISYDKIRPVCSHMVLVINFDSTEALSSGLIIHQLFMLSRSPGPSCHGEAMIH